MLHNTLVDLSINNNIIYNNLLKDLHLDLSLYGFKITPLYNIDLYKIISFYTNNDSKLLHSLLNIYNKLRGFKHRKKNFFVKKFFMNKIKNKYKYNT
jgi:hypothetical protein